jgi:MFS family permease
LRWALRALCLTEIVSWGVLYYAFPVLAPSITADTGWSATELTAIFSTALVISGLAGIAVGRVISVHGPRWVMTSGSLVAVGSIAVIASAHSLWQFITGWLLAGLSMSGVLYAPAFAAVTVWFGRDRVRALTAITLVAGLASTVFAPLTALLDEHLSWRATYLVLGVVLAVLTVVPHAVALRPTWPNVHIRHPQPRLEEPRAELDEPAGEPVRRRAFLRLTFAYTAMSLCSFAVVVNLVALMQSRDYSTTAGAWALGIGGVGQVLGRLGYARLARRIGLAARTVAVFAVVAATTALFALVTGPYAMLLLISLVAGNARGLSTLLSATAVSDRWGVARYARLNGLFTAPTMIAGALAPFVGAGLAALLGGYPAAFIALAVLGAAAAFLVAQS